LRYTFGRRSLVAGGDYTLSKLLGHSSVNVTEQLYAHLLKEDLEPESSALRSDVMTNGEALSRVWNG
jgi:integrase/recombinase XerD